MKTITEWLTFWTFFGLFGQFLFFMRFVVQWIHSERQKKSVVPLLFWYLSIAGSFILTIYAIHRRDPVFFLGSALSMAIYVRNIVLIRRENQLYDESL